MKRLPKSVHNHGSISMTYGQYLYNFPQGHKRKNISNDSDGYLLKDDNEEFYWVTLSEYNEDGRKIYGKHWVNMEDRIQTSDKESISKEIKKVLRKYFDTDDNGDPNEEFDEYFTAQEAIDEIHDIVGDI